MATISETRALSWIWLVSSLRGLLHIPLNSLTAQGPRRLCCSYFQDMPEGSGVSSRIQQECSGFTQEVGLAQEGKVRVCVKLKD